MPITVHVQQKTGRPMQPGTLVADKSGRMGIFLTYCTHGDKVVFYKDEIPALVRRWDKSKRSLKVRLVKRVVARLSDLVDD